MFGQAEGAQSRVRSRQNVSDGASNGSTAVMGHRSIDPGVPYVASVFVTNEAFNHKPASSRHINHMLSWCLREAIIEVQRDKRTTVDRWIFERRLENLHFNAGA